MIDAQAIVDAHEAAKAAMPESASGDLYGAQNNAAPRQFPLAGKKSSARPLADPVRRNPVSKA